MTDALHDSMNHSVVVAIAKAMKSVGGVKDLELGYRKDDVPIEQAEWYAQVHYLSRTLVVENKPSLAEAAFELYKMMIDGGKCLNCLRIGEMVVIPGTGEPDRCERYVEGESVVKGCDKDTDPDAPEPTRMRLARDLHEADCPVKMVLAAAAGYYDDFLSPNPFAMLELHAELERLGKDEMAEKVTMGEWDAQKWESDAWAASSEGQEALAELGPQADKLLNEAIKPNRAQRRAQQRKRK